MTELVKVADINKAHKNPIAELVQICHYRRYFINERN